MGSLYIKESKLKEAESDSGTADEGEGRKEKYAKPILGIAAEHFRLHKLSLIERPSPWALHPQTGSVRKAA